MKAGGIVIPLNHVERKYVKDHVRKKWESLVDSNRKVWSKYGSCVLYTMNELLLVTGHIKTDLWIIAALTGNGDFDIIARPSGSIFPAELVPSDGVRGEAHSCIGLTEALEKTNQRLKDAGYSPMPLPPPGHCLAIDARRFEKRDRSRMWVEPNLEAAAEPQDPTYHKDDESQTAVRADASSSEENLSHMVSMDLSMTTPIQLMRVPQAISGRYQASSSGKRQYCCKCVV